MKKLLLAAAGAALALASLLTTPVAAQSAQERLDARYDRALAAGYKALMLCSAIGNAEANGATRTPESVHEWELTGIQAPLNDIVRGLEYEIVRRPSGQIAHVAVKWDEQMPSRIAVYFATSGCSALPIGTPENWSDPERPIEIEASGADGENGAFPEGGNVRKRFSETLALAFSSDTYGEGARSTAVVVLQDGKLMEERYAEGFGPNTPQRTWSVAKSIAATFVGTAVHSREYSVEDPIGLNYWRVGGRADPRNAITIDHALRMATGRYSDTPGNRTDPIYWGGASVDEQATKWPLLHAPGTIYRYANNDTLMAVKAIEPFIDYYTPAALLAKIGMKHTVVETDIKGNYVLSSQVWSTAPDLAKLGQLYLDDGIWKGERILPENWSDYVSAPSGPQPEGTQWGYGAGWWTFRRPEGNAFESIPDDAFAARGNRGQYVVVVPSRNVVIVRRGEDMVGTRFNIAAFTRDVLAAMEEK